MLYRKCTKKYLIDQIEAYNTFDVFFNPAKYNINIRPTNILKCSFAADSTHRVRYALVLRTKLTDSLFRQQIAGQSPANCRFVRAQQSLTLREMFIGL